MAKEIQCIVVSKESFSISTTGMVTGEIWFEFSEFSFPEKHWNDFVAVVLSWWCEAMNSIRYLGENSILRFMDGPYEVQASRVASDSIKLSFAEGRSRRVAHTSQVSVKDFKNSLIRASQAVLSFCGNHKIENNDIEKLRNEVRILADY